MTLNELPDLLINLGFEDVDNNGLHFSIGNGKVHIYLWSDSGKHMMTIKRFANKFLFARNMADTKETYAISDIESIRKDGKRIIFSIRGANDLNLNENKGHNKMIKIGKEQFNEADVSVLYIFEINTNNNIRFITLTDFTRSKSTSYAEYYTATKEWDGDKKSINDIMAVLMSYKLNIDKFKDGFVEVYSNGKTQEFGA